MEAIEKTGETVEDAIAAGLEELGVTPADVIIEVLEEPTRGLFGLGSKTARVRLVLLSGRRPKTSDENTATMPDSQPEPPVDEYDSEDDSVTETEEIDDSELDEDARIGKEILNELLENMQINGKVVIQRAEATRDDEQTHWILNIIGKNMRQLIGRRGETLTSLQYITRLIASRRLERRANIIIDAGGYKSGRSDRLRGLANRMADQSIQQNRVITLEPMPPHERRIIHLTLRNREDVTTESVGEGNSRKVTISPNN